MSHERKTAGVLGGMGPNATVDFMRTVLERTPVKSDLDQVHSLVDQNPGLPSRQAAILGAG